MLHDPNDPIFVWFDSSRPENYLRPYYVNHVETLGTSPFTHRSDLLKVHWSDTICKRIKSAKEGTVIKLHHLHSCGDMCIRRLTQEEIDLLQEIENKRNELHTVCEEIKNTVPHLVAKENLLNGDIKKSNKKLDMLRNKIGKQVKKAAVR
jgi:hypothetical protein